MTRKARKQRADQSTGPDRDRSTAEPGRGEFYTHLEGAVELTFKATRDKAHQKSGYSPDEDGPIITGSSVGCGGVEAMLKQIREEQISLSDELRSAFCRIYQAPFEAGVIGRGDRAGGGLNPDVSDGEILIQLLDWARGFGFIDGMIFADICKTNHAVQYGKRGGHKRKDEGGRKLHQVKIDRKYAEWKAAHEAGLTEEPWRYGQACLELSEETGIPACTIRNNAQNPEYRPRKRKK